MHGHLTRLLTHFSYRKTFQVLTIKLIVLHAAHTKVHALVKVFVVHVLWVQTSSKSAVFRRPTIWMWKHRRVPHPAEFTFIWHCELERRLTRSLGSHSHGTVLPLACLLLPPEKNWCMQLVFDETQCLRFKITVVRNLLATFETSL